MLELYNHELGSTGKRRCILADLREHIIRSMLDRTATWISFMARFFCRRPTRKARFQIRFTPFSKPLHLRSSQGSGSRILPDWEENNNYLAWRLLDDLLLQKIVQIHALFLSYDDYVDCLQYSRG